MALDNPTPEQAMEALPTLQQGQELLINYYGTEEKAFFVDTLPEPEHEGKIIVLLDDKYQQDLVDINAGEILKITDDVPYSDVRFSKMMDLGGPLGTSNGAGERPEVIGEMHQIIIDTYESIDAVKSAAADLGSLEDDDASEILVKARTILSKSPDYVESDSDLELIQSVEITLSDRLNQTSEVEVVSAIDEDVEDQDIVDEADALLAGSILEEDAIGLQDDELDVEDPSLPFSKTLDPDIEYSAGDGSSQIVRPTDDLHHSMGPVYGSGGAPDVPNIGLGQAIGSLLRTPLALASYAGESLSNFARLKTEEGQDRYQERLASYREEKFDQKVDIASDRLADVKEMTKELRTPEVEELLLKMNNYEANDIAAERARQEAMHDLRNILDVPASDEETTSRLDNAINAMNDFSVELSGLEDYREKRDPDNFAKAEIVDELATKGGESLEELAELAKGNDNAESKIEAMRELIAKLVILVKQLLGINEQTAEKAHGIQPSMRP